MHQVVVRDINDDKDHLEIIRIGLRLQVVDVLEQSVVGVIIMNRVA
jgi:hypothetical protein